MHSPPLLLYRFGCLLAVCLAVLFPTRPARAAEETVIEIKAVAGLRYDIPRFQVKPGAKVRLTLENADDMAHNLLVLAPGSRVEIVTAAMTMPLTPTQDFVPKSPKVLWTIPVLTPGKTGEVSFTAPAKEAVYPYVCSYPGHGFIMFGAMYVGTQPMPPLAKDPNIPDTAKESAGNVALHAYDTKPPRFYRIFMRDSGPASFAVALPGEQNFCWDAGVCRLRYAWRGGFVDPMPHWSGNGDGFAEVKGRIYWRAGAEFPLRLGARDKAPKVKFRGYRLVAGVPEFHYEVDGAEVRESITAQHHGGLEIAYAIANAKAPVSYIAGPERGAKLASSVGKFESGVLTLTPEQARSFTLTLTEIPGAEPLAYWSMNDVLSFKKPLPVPGVKGRAISFDGKKSQFATGVKTDALKRGATLAIWARLKKAEAMQQVFIGAKSDRVEFALGSNVGGGAGFGVTATVNGATTGVTTGQPPDDDWHQLAVTLTGERITLFFDGKPYGSMPAVALPEGAEIYLGSLGGKAFAAATLDEARIFDRVLPDQEIAATFAGEAPPAFNPTQQ